MEWQYYFPATQAIHPATGARFRIVFIRGSQDIEIHPESGTEDLSSVEITRLIETLRQYVTQEILRDELRRLIEEKCKNNLTDAARAVSIVGGKTVTSRTIQSWLIEPGRPSSRNCPKWAVDALRQKETPKHNAQQLDPKPFHEDPYTWANEVRDRRSILIATEKIEQEERCRVKWKTVPAADFPVAVANLEMELWDWIHALQGSIHTLITALNDSSSLDEAKEKIRNSLDADRAIRQELHLARKEIETEPPL